MVVNHHCAVLGKPIAHSLSPVLHNAAYRALDLNDWEFTKHEVGESDLDSFLRSLDSSWAGLSLTMPLKQTIQPYGVPSNRWAELLRVVNTAIFDWDHMIPAPNGEGELPSMKLYNTDVAGIILAVAHAREQAGLDAARKDSNVLIIGNGNTATSAAAAITSMAADDAVITVAARTPGKNPAIKTLITDALPNATFDEIALSDVDQVAAVASQATFAISTIPSFANETVAKVLSNAQPTGLLLDVIYDQRPSEPMKAWRAQGGTAIGGEEMLLYQAVAQVMLMTGKWSEDKTCNIAATSEGNNRIENIVDPALITAMRAALEEAL